MKQTISITNLALIISLAITGISAEQKKQSLAINPIQIVASTPLINEHKINETFSQEMERVGQFDIVKSEFHKELSTKDQFNNLSVGDHGYALGVSMVTFGIIENMGPYLRLRYAIYDVETDQKIKEVTEYIPADADDIYTNTIPKMVRKLTGTKKKFKMPKAVTWTAIAGATTIAGYLFASSIMTDSQEQEASASTNVVGRW